MIYLSDFLIDSIDLIVSFYLMNTDFDRRFFMKTCLKWINSIDACNSNFWASLLEENHLEKEFMDRVKESMIQIEKLDGEFFPSYLSEFADPDPDQELIQMYDRISEADFQIMKRFPEFFYQAIDDGRITFENFPLRYSNDVSKMVSVLHELTILTVMHELTVRNRPKDFSCEEVNILLRVKQLKKKGTVQVGMCWFDRSA